MLLSLTLTEGAGIMNGGKGMDDTSLLGGEERALCQEKGRF